MIVPVMALGAELATAGTLGWVWLGRIIPRGERSCMVGHRASLGKSRHLALSWSNPT